MSTLVVLQPGYMPWLGFFDQVRRCDHFVFYDDVQYDKHGWRNRNRILTANGPSWLTVPVLIGGKLGQKINQVQIKPGVSWARKHIESIRQAYAKSPHLDPYLGELAELLGQPWAMIADLDIALAQLMCRWFGLERPMFRSSELGIDGDRNMRLLGLCQHFGVDRYLSGSSARDYLDVGLFNAHGIEVEWQDFAHPTYPQQHGPFVPFMSALDLVLNVGPDCRVLLESANCHPESAPQTNQ